MYATKVLLALLAGSNALAVAVPVADPMPTPGPELGNSFEKRATSCTFTAASQVSASKKSCATIVLDNIAVPAGETLDLTDLTSGTNVREQWCQEGID